MKRKSYSRRGVLSELFETRGYAAFEETLLMGSPQLEESLNMHEIRALCGTFQGWGVNCSSGLGQTRHRTLSADHIMQR